MHRFIVSAIAVVSFSGGWVVQPSGTRSSFRGLSVVDAKTVWVSGSRANFLRTTDGGTTWKLDSIAGADSLDLRDIQAFDAITAVAISAGPADSPNRTSPGRMARPAASAEVQPSGRRALLVRSKSAPDPACHRDPSKWTR